MQSRVPLTRYLIEKQRKQQCIDDDLRLLIEVVARACKAISAYVSKGELGNILGSTNSTNVQGEVQKKLDILSNEILLDATEWGGHLAGLASEEMEKPYSIPKEYPRGKYLLLFDPLDGSSNIDVNISVGTIFSVLQHTGDNQEVDEGSFLQPGYKQVMAGYTLYGPSTQMMLTLGDGVDAFTLHKEHGTFMLTERGVKIPEETQEYAINMSYQRHWYPPMTRYVQELLAGETGPRGKNFNMRWVASMVADVHRLLTRGGVFIYPRDQRDPSAKGRLRLMYEANPMSFIVEQAGGMSTNGLQRMMDIQPEELHERVAVFMGSKKEIEVVTRYHQEYAAQQSD